MKNYKAYGSKDLLLRAEMPAEEAEAAVERLRSAPKRPQSEEQTILRAQVALMLILDLLELRWHRSDAGRDQTRKIWDRLIEDYPELLRGIWDRTQSLFQDLNGGDESNSSILLNNSAAVTTAELFNSKGSVRRL